MRITDQGVQVDGGLIPWAEMTELGTAPGPVLRVAGAGLEGEAPWDTELHQQLTRAAAPHRRPDPVTGGVVVAKGSEIPNKKAPIVTSVLLILHVAAWLLYGHVVSPGTDPILLGGVVTTQVHAGELWRLLMGNALSHGWTHFLAVGLGLLFIGGLVEAMLGSARTLAIWGLGSLAGWGWASVIPHAWPMHGGSVGFVALCAACMWVMLRRPDLPPEMKTAPALQWAVLVLGLVAFTLEWWTLGNPVHLGAGLAGLGVGVLAQRAERGWVLVAAPLAALLAWGMGQTVWDVLHPAQALERYVVAAPDHCGAMGDLAFGLAGQPLEVPSHRAALQACDDPWAAAGLAALDQDREAFEMALRTLESPDAREDLEQRWKALFPGVDAEP